MFPLQIYSRENSPIFGILGAVKTVLFLYFLFLSIYLFIYLFIYFETGFLCVVLAVLELCYVDQPGLEQREIHVFLRLKDAHKIFF